MSVLLTNGRVNRSSILYYAPPHYRARGPANIRPVLEKLSRGERWTQIGPALMPDSPDNDLFPPPDLSILKPDPFSLVGKVATAIVCVAVVVAPGLYFFGSREDFEATAQNVATQIPDARALEQAAVVPELAPVPEPAPVQEPTPAAVEPVANEPERADPVAAKAAEPRSDADVILMAPLKMWGMFPTDEQVAASAVAIQKTDREAAPAVSKPQAQAVQTNGRQARRQHRASARKSQRGVTEAKEQTAAAQDSTTQTDQDNPIQRAFRDIFGLKPQAQPPADKNTSAGDKARAE